MPARDSYSALPAWQKTWLWKTLQKRAKERGNHHASEFLPTLELWMRDLHSVLHSGGTAPLDFTLHDSGHALRVAHRMAELITPTIRRNLSDYELALLLLAAYGHDIGMTPERQKVQNHHRHLLHPAESALTDEEKQRFQKFLDEWPDHPVTPPLSNTLADELTAFYVRERHNDWSADWLRENLKTQNFGFFPDVVNVLIRLCSSHHDGFDVLARSSFDPFLTTGVQPQLIHLRYLACILRLADILENDPGHLPETLFRHREAASYHVPLIRWQRGHAIAQLAKRLPVHNPVGVKSIKRKWHLALTRDIRPSFTHTIRHLAGGLS